MLHFYSSLFGFFFFFFFDFYSSEASGGNLHTQEVAVITTLRGASELFAKGSELCWAPPPAGGHGRSQPEGAHPGVLVPVATLVVLV